MKQALKEIGLIVLGAFFALVIILGITLNNRITNVEMVHNNLVKMLMQNQQQAQSQVPKPVPPVTK
jgi:uncharacterized membrane protein